MKLSRCGNKLNKHVKHAVQKQTQWDLLQIRAWLLQLDCPPRSNSFQETEHCLSVWTIKRENAWRNDENLILTEERLFRRSRFHCVKLSLWLHEQIVLIPFLHKNISAFEPFVPSYITRTKVTSIFENENKTLSFFRHCRTRQHLSNQIRGITQRWNDFLWNLQIAPDLPDNLLDLIWSQQRALAHTGQYCWDLAVPTKATHEKIPDGNELTSSLDFISSLVLVLFLFKVWIWKHVSFNVLLLLLLAKADFSSVTDFTHDMQQPLFIRCHCQIARM